MRSDGKTSFFNRKARVGTTGEYRCLQAPHLAMVQSTRECKRHSSSADLAVAGILEGGCGQEPFHV